MPGTKNSALKPAPARLLTTTTTVNATLPHPTIASHSELACDKCARKFETWGDLNKHLDAHKRVQVQYWCIPQCGEAYMTATGLQAHQARCEEIAAARYFNATFAPGPITAVPNHLVDEGSPTKLSTRSARSSRWPKCDQCPREFKTRPKLEEHVAAHERGTLVFCTTPGCGRGYPSAREVKVHQKTTGCGGSQPRRGSITPDLDISELQLGHREPRSDRGRHCSGSTGSSAGNPGEIDNLVTIGTVFTNEGPRTLQDWQLQGLGDSYRKSAYPEEEEVRRLSRELFVSHDIVRRWFSAQRLQGR